MSENTFRTFLAIELDSSIRTILHEIQGQLKKSGADVKWVNAENIHLTLKFFGNVSTEKVVRLIAILKENLREWKDFSFELMHLGAFPKIENPKIIWAGITSGQEEIKKIVSMLEDKICFLGFEKEPKDFVLHITLGRLRSSDNRCALGKLIQNYSFFQPLNQKVNQVVLFKSTLTSKGPIYEALARFDLK